MTPVFKPGDRVQRFGVFGTVTENPYANREWLYVRWDEQHFGLSDWQSPNSLKTAPSPDPTEPVPDVAEDREGLREDFQRLIDAADGLTPADVLSGERPRAWTIEVVGVLRRLVKIGPKFIDRHTAKAINHAGMAQDSALEVASLKKDRWTALQAMQVVADALAAEQSAHAETRKALEPFAAAADELDDTQKDADHLWESPVAMSLTAGDLRRARVAGRSPLSNTEEG